MTAVADLERRVARLEHGFDGWTVAESLHAAECLRRLAQEAGWMPVAQVAAALRDALQAEGRAVRPGLWLPRLRAAIAGAAEPIRHAA